MILAGLALALASQAAAPAPANAYPYPCLLVEHDERRYRGVHVIPPSLEIPYVFFSWAEVGAAGYGAYVAPTACWPFPLQERP